MRKILFFLSCFLVPSLPLLFAVEEASPPPSETEAVEEKIPASPMKGMAGGLKQVAFDGPKEFVEETLEETPRRPTLTNMVEGVNRGTEKLVDHTIKGAYRIATLGTSELESYEVEEPEKGSGDITKFKISIPGT